MSAYTEAVSYIDNIVKFTTKNDLGHTRECLEKLGHPEKAFDVIHVAGTNGKGSTCAFMASALTAGGVKMGLFTSPHLIRMNERFRVDGAMVSDASFLRAFERVRGISEEMTAEGKGHPTYFEFLFLMGMLLFQEAGTDLVILETGLGGRLDATNVIPDPLVSVIVSIGFDHMKYLGNTIAAIAGEKAGIIKEGIPVVADDTSAEALAVIRAKAEEKGSALHILADAESKVVRAGEDGIDFTTEIPSYKGTVFHLPFAAPYQVNNASLALLALDAVRDRYPVDAETAEKGLRCARWDGRMQCIGEKTYVDGAHNAHGVAAFLSAAKLIAGKEPVTLVFGAMADKDYRPMTQEIVDALRPVRVYTTKADEYRGAEAEMLAQLYRDAGAQQVEAVDVPEEAWEKAVWEHKDGFLFGVGSLYLIGRILKIHDQL